MASPPTPETTVPLSFEALVLAVEARLRQRSRERNAVTKARNLARQKAQQSLDAQLAELDERIDTEVRAMSR